MKASIIKKMLMAALTASLVMAPVMGVFASSDTPQPEPSTTEASAPAPSPVEAAVTEATSGAITSVAEIPASSTVAGVKTTTAGTYLAQSVSGIAATTPAASIAQGYGLAAGEKPYVKVSDMDPKKSYLAKQCMEAAAASQGAVVGPMLNLEFGKMSGGKYSQLSAEGPEIRMSVGLPKNFAQDGKTYGVIRVRAGGVVTILKDVDDNPNTVTFDTTGGAGAYALIKY